MNNIFLNHWRRRDGAIYKDLGSMPAADRIPFLNNCIDDARRYIPLNRQRRLIRFYERLIKFIEKDFKKCAMKS